MELKKINVRPFEKGNLKAFITVVTSDGFVIDGFTVVSGSNGLFIGWPQQLQKDGKYKDLVLMDNKDNKNQVNEKLLSAYKSSLTSQPASSGKQQRQFSGTKQSKQKQQPSQEDDNELWS